MANTSTSRTGGRLLALAIPAVVAAGAWWGIAQPLVDGFRDRAEDIARERRLLGELRAVAGRTDEARGLREVAQRTSASGLFLQGSSEAVKAANLQSAVATVVMRGGGAKLRVARALPPRERDGVQLFAVEVDLVGDLADVTAVLRELDAAEPVLIVDQVRLARIPPRADDARDDLLEARLTVLAATARGGN